MDVREVAVGYVCAYESTLGGITLASNGTALTGLWFDGQKYDRAGLGDMEKTAPDLPVFVEARRWLDEYFAGRDPGAIPPCEPAGSAFQVAVWKTLANIPYGRSVTYGDIAAILEAQTQRHSSARAVGGAVGRNPVSIFLPCHRVIGASGNLTGYAGGIKRKIALLELEGFDVSRFHVPTNGTAL